MLAKKIKGERTIKEIILTKAAPGAIGPYSQAIRANGFVFVSGQLPVNPKTGELVVAEISAQTEQSIKNLSAVLQSAGCTLENVVKTTIFLKNIADFAAMNKVYGKYFTKDCPARSAFEVANLPKDALVEIEAIAVHGAQ